MLIPPPQAQANGETEAPQIDTNEIDNVTGHEAIQSLFSATKCYDLIGASNKVVIFETSITFYQAFVALSEHDAQVAPIWDPSRQIFIAMLTPSDFLDTIRLCIRNRIPPAEVIHKPIWDVINTSVGSFSHSMFHTIDAEDTVYEMCKSLQMIGNDYAPIVDSEDGTNLVALLGYLDIVNLMSQAAAQAPQLFTETVEDLRNRSFSVANSVIAGNSSRRRGSGTRRSGIVPLSDTTVTKSTILGDVLSLMYERELGGIPVVDDAMGNRVIGIYHKEDVSFIATASTENQEHMITHALNIAIGDVVSHQMDELVYLTSNNKVNNNSPSSSSGNASRSVSGSAAPVAAPVMPPYKLCTCTIQHNIKQVLDLMMSRRVTRVVCVDELGRCLCVINIADIVWYYFD